MSGRLVLFVALCFACVCAPGLAKRPPIRITPSPPHPQDTIRFSWIARYRTNNSLDAYRVRFIGPGGTHCDIKTTYTAELTWAPQDNVRFTTHRVGISVRSRREANPPPLVRLAWCPGTYKGRLVFRDYPAGQTAPIVYRFIGNIAFRVR